MTKPRNTLAEGWARAQPWVMGGFGFALLILLVQWGGTARPGPLFVLGVAVLSSLMLAFAGLVWWLYLSPMPAAVQSGQSTPRLHRTIAAPGLLEVVLEPRVQRLLYIAVNQAQLLVGRRHKHPLKSPW